MWMMKSELAVEFPSRRWWTLVWLRPKPLEVENERGIRAALAERKDGNGELVCRRCKGDAMDASVCRVNLLYIERDKRKNYLYHPTTHNGMESVHLKDYILMRLVKFKSPLQFLSELSQLGLNWINKPYLRNYEARVLQKWCRMSTGMMVRIPGTTNTFGYVMGFSNRNESPTDGSDAPKDGQIEFENPFGVLQKRRANLGRFEYKWENNIKIKLDEEETSSFRDRLLPLIIGLLRTAKLPYVLRIYCDTLTADMKTAIKTAVADLLPVLLTRPLESDFTPGERMVDADGGGSSLASKLRSLSSESFVQLLAAIFNIVRAHLVRASEVKKAVEWIMCNIDGHYAADSVAAAIALGAAVAEAAQETDGQAGSFLLYSPQRNAAKMPSMQGKANNGANSSNVSKNFR
ncbi:hypothetical protein HYC85_018658 [Camellia sinensis]|uniref:Uncharacterized protein n=1 Tax=Camellia sinensis TaxID=4442 RepID=A0A7J7GX94_CAMSI|nr:hypothetical protein HYC85_018658 [Camellia sinensis]